MHLLISQKVFELHHFFAKPILSLGETNVKIDLKEIYSAS